MGYKAQRRILVIREWPDETLAGLEVKARSVKTGEFLQFGKAMTRAQAAGLTAEDGVAAVDGLLELFARSLVSWNLEDEEGNPVPATLAGLLDQDNDWTQRVIMTWLEAVGGAPGPLGQRSTGGETSLAASIPMEPLSASRAS